MRVFTFARTLNRSGHDNATPTCQRQAAPYERDVVGPYDGVAQFSAKPT